MIAVAPRFVGAVRRISSLRPQHAHFHSSPRPKTRVEGSSASASESNATFDYSGDNDAVRKVLFEHQIEKMLEEDQKASSYYGFKEFMLNLNKNFVSWLTLAGVVVYAGVHFKIMNTIQDFANFLAILTTMGIIIKPVFGFCKSLLEQPKSVSRVMWVVVSASEKRLEDKISASEKRLEDKISASEERVMGAIGELNEAIKGLAKKIDGSQN